MNWLLSLSTVFFIATNAHAVKVEFPDEELAQESVYPVFDTSTSVKKKNVVTENRFEAELFAGWTLNDSMVEPFNYGGAITYHLSDITGIELFFTTFSSKISGYAEELKSKPGYGMNFVDQVPKPQYAFLGSYHITPYYGKISLTKQTVWNIMIYGTAGIGLISFDTGDLTNATWNGGDSSLTFSAGLGLKIYFTNKLSLVSDLRYLFYQGPNPVYKSPSTPAFEAHSVLNSIITVGMGYIL